MKYNNSGKFPLFLEGSLVISCIFLTSLSHHVVSEHAKLGMGPLWAEIMDNINMFIGEEAANEAANEALPLAPRLALFSGHDTTIMPLLASLGPKLWNDTDWASYASMFIIEVSRLPTRAGRVVLWENLLGITDSR